MAAAMAGAAVSLAANVLPTAAGMTQAQKHHDKEVELQVKAEKTTQKLHMHGIINETRHFVEAFMQAEAVHAQALAQGKQQHSESMAAARRGEQREGMRDAQTNATTRVNTVLVCDTVLLGCAFGLVVEGLPEPWGDAVDSTCGSSGSAHELSTWEMVDAWDWVLLMCLLQVYNYATLACRICIESPSMYMHISIVRRTMRFQLIKKLLAGDSESLLRSPCRFEVGAFFCTDSLETHHRYILCLGAAIGCLTVSMYCGMIFLDLLTDFQIDDHHTDMTVAELSRFLRSANSYKSSTNGTRIFTRWLNGSTPGDDSVDGLAVTSSSSRPGDLDSGARQGDTARRRPKIWYTYARRGLEVGLVFLVVAAAVLLFIRLIRQFHNGWAAVAFVGCCTFTVVLVAVFRRQEQHDRAATKSAYGCCSAAHESDCRYCCPLCGKG